MAKIFFSLLMLPTVMLMGCMGSDSVSDGDALFPVTVEPGDTTLNGSTCDIEFTVTNLSQDQEYTLIWMNISLSDQNDETFTELFTTGQRALIIGSQLPSGVSVLANETIDFGDSELSEPPYEGFIQIQGAAFQRIVYFFGTFSCE